MSVSFEAHVSRPTSRCIVRTCSRLIPLIPRSTERRQGRLGFTIVVAMIAVAATWAIFGGLAEPAHAQGRRSGGSFVVGGTTIHVAADETVEGGVVSLGGKVTVDGHVSGAAVSVGGPVEVNGTVDGDVVSVGSLISLGESARVTGDVTSVGGTVYRAEGAIVQGDVTSVGFPSLRFNMRDLRWHRMPWGFSWAFWRMPWGLFGAMWAVRLVGALVLSLIIIAIWPNHTASVAAAVETRPGRVAAIGLVAWLLFVPAMILLAITLIGILLIPIWVLLYVAAGALGHTAIAILIGDRVARLANSHMSMLAKVIAGALALALLGWIPGLGIIVAIAVAVIGLGAVVETRFGTNRPWFPQRQPTPPQQQENGNGHM